VPLRVSGNATLHVEQYAKRMQSGVSLWGRYNTCAGRMGSLGYEELDAQTFASWVRSLHPDPLCLCSLHPHLYPCVYVHRPFTLSTKHTQGAGCCNLAPLASCWCAPGVGTGRGLPQVRQLQPWDHHNSAIPPVSPLLLGALLPATLLFSMRLPIVILCIVMYRHIMYWYTGYAASQSCLV